MAKDKLTDYDSTASGNLDVGGISVAEGMLPSGVNNAIRELMSHQADAFSAGTPLYVDQTNNRVGIGNAAPATALEVDANGATVATFDRATSDGSIVDFRKDGTTVGSIGAKFSGRSYIASGSSSNTGVRFDSNFIAPADATGANRDNAINLGSSGDRFKDLYLSGGAYLGGTGSANYLDDYEEGSFNFVLTGSASAPTTSQTTTGYYTKVGRFVTITAYFNNKDLTGASGDLKATGLPFVSNSDSTNRGANTCALFGFSFSGSLYVDVPPNSTTVFFQESRSNSSWVPIAVSAASTKYVQLTLNYMTS